MVGTGSSTDQEPLSALREVVGSEFLITEGPGLTAAETATFATQQRVRAVLRPATREQVQRCVRIANQFKLPIYPVSTGRNWGLGSAVPASEDCVVMRLDRLTRIVDFDEEMGTLSVEPGVTFRAAYEFLRERSSKLFISSTGASPDSSLIGNTVERGDGSGPYGDHFAHIAGMQVVLPTGECIHTGFERFEGTSLGKLHRWGVGPSLDGLFSQSALGIVTQMTFWLKPLPGALCLVRFEVNTTEQLPALIDALRGLKLDGTVQAPVGVWNDYRVISTLGQYPWDVTRGRTPLSRTDLEKLKRDISPARWYGVLPLYSASVEQNRAAASHVEQQLSARVDQLHFDYYSGDNSSGKEFGSGEDPALLFMQGIPHTRSLASVYWRKRTAPPADPDPDRDRCGVLWACPALPFRGADVKKAVEPLEEFMLSHGFEPLLAMISQTERSFYLVPLIIYDRDVEGEDERAQRCHDELLQRFCGEGLLPHRLGIQSMGALPQAKDDSAVLYERLKRALDPAGILAPGRYDFGPRKS